MIDRGILTEIGGFTDAKNDREIEIFNCQNISMRVKLFNLINHKARRPEKPQ
jgi:hypothetical protein